MRNGVFARLRSRLSCLNAGRLTRRKESFPVEDEWARAATPFERGIEGLEIKDPEGKNIAAGLHRHLAWMRALCEVDRKFLAGLDRQLVTDALLETVARLFPGSATTIWLLDGTTRRLEAVACRNLEPECQAIPTNGNLGFVMEVLEKRRPAMITNVGAYSRRKDIKFLREHRMISALGFPMLSSDEILGVLALYTRVPAASVSTRLSF